MPVTKWGKPRSHDGGRSPRHGARHAARGSVLTFAPSWTDAAAQVVLDALHEGSVAAGVGITKHVRGIMDGGAPRGRSPLVATLRLCAPTTAPWWQKFWRSTAPGCWMWLERRGEMQQSGCS